jgi:hypothetical protein
MHPLQRHVYFVSGVLKSEKTHYPQVQNLLYVVSINKQKHIHYFESHPITVVTSFPLGEVTCNPYISKRIVKWALELMGYGSPTLSKQ